MVEGFQLIELPSLSVLERLAQAADDWPETLRAALRRALERIAKETRTDAEARAILEGLANRWNHMFNAASNGSEWALGLMRRDGVNAMDLAACADRVTGAAMALGRGT